MRILSLLVCLATTLSLHASSTICLNMIVKDESLFIREALDSIKPYINYWVIIDTGSSDGTQNIIKEHMKDIPGELHERPWVDFAHNRNEALMLAKDKADYLFWMDGDDWMEMDSDFKMPALEEGAYLIKVKTKGKEFYRYHLHKSCLPWKWKGVLHEILECDTSFTSKILRDINYCFSREGTRSLPSDYYDKHIAILEKAFKKEPENRRYAFYLAESYRGGGYLKQALEMYNKRLSLGGSIEEEYYILLQIAKIHKALCFDDDIVIACFNKAHRCLPHRLEPIFYLAEIYNARKKYDLAYECIKGSQFVPKITHPEIALRETWIEEWGLHYQLSLCTYSLGHYHESLAICNKLLTQETLPEPMRIKAEFNQHLSAERIKKDSSTISINIDQSQVGGIEKVSSEIANMIKNKIDEAISLKNSENGNN